MKRIVYIVGVISFVFNSLSAQNETDALRYSKQNIVGTARAIGLGGAVGALGGDFSSLSVNPAGLGIYRSSELTLSPSIFWDNSSSSFLGNSYEETKYNPNIGNFGFVSTYDLNQQNGWVSTNFAFGYNRTANFNRNILMSGINNSSSLLDNFTDFANANPENLNSFYEELAHDVLLLPYDSVYWNDIQNAGYGQLQRRSLNSSGSTGEYTFSFGANYNHRLYLGATFGISRLRFEQDIIHVEKDIDNSIGFFDEFIFRENLRTTGNGYTFKAGAIVRPIDILRLGIAFHLPTFYNLNDRFTTEMEAFIDPGEGYPKQTAFSPIGDYDYKLKTPPRYIGSMALTIGKMGLISFDYERVDYTKAKLNARDDDFFDENGLIKNTYRATNNLRLGGELRFGTSYLRGGYSFSQSPYKSYEPNTNANLNTFSAGMGMRGMSFYVDIGYALSNIEEVYYLYLPQGNTQGSVNSSRGNNMILTVGYRF